LNPIEIERLIREAIPGAEVRVRTDDGRHFTASVVAEAFRSKSRVQQHQMINAALKDIIGGDDLHALALQTSVPE